MKKYTILNYRSEPVWTFKGTEEFIDESISIFKQTCEEFRFDEDTEARNLGFNLTEYVENEDGDFTGGEIIIDDDCYDACIRFWEKSRPKCKVVIEEVEA